MKRLTATNRMIALLAALLLANWGSSQPAVAANPIQTDLDVFALTDAQGLSKVNGQQWNVGVPGFNLLRAFHTASNQPFLLALNGNTGRAIVFALGIDGSLGNSVWETPARADLRCTSIGFSQTSGSTKLITHDSFTGKLRSFEINNDGSLNLASLQLTTVSSLRDRSLFNIYAHPVSGYQVVAVDPWTGAATSYSPTSGSTAQQKWTRGWTSMDHLSINGETYRLLYKATGDPTLKPGESGDQLGRFVIEKVGANGLDAQGVQDTSIAANYSAVRFIRFYAGQGISWNGWEVHYGVLCYRRTTGEFALYAFTPQSGIGAKLSSGQLKEGNPAVASPAYVAIEPYVINGKACVAFVNDDNAKPVGLDQAETMAQILHDAASDSVVGYQFMLAQSGRIIYSRAWGKAKLASAPAQTVDMTSRTPLNIGSVSKMITATTVLKLVEQGKINLASPVGNYLPSGQLGPSSWAKTTPVLNLLTHTSGMGTGTDICVPNTKTLTMDCAPFFGASPNQTCGLDANGRYNCYRFYNNANLVAARKVIEGVTNTSTSPEITKKTHELWADSVDLNQMTCQIGPAEYYFGPCDGSANCYPWAGNSYLQVQDTDDWSTYCSSGGWHVNSSELMAFLGALRYGRIIKDQGLLNLLFNPSLADLSGIAGSTALSWDPPKTINGEPALSKGGYIPWSGVASKAFIIRLPNNCDAVVQLNTETSVPFTSVLTNAYAQTVK